MRITTKSVLGGLLLGVAVAALPACRSGGGPVRTDVPQPAPVAVQALMGTWYEVARIPNLVERGHMGSQHQYTLQPEGEIAVRYRYRTGPDAEWKEMSARATVLQDSGNRQWRMRFFRMLPLTQRVLDVAPDGSWMLLDAPGRDLAWIFTRTPDLTDADYLQLRERLRAHGVNTDKVWRVVHRDEDVGARGFDQPKRR